MLWNMSRRVSVWGSLLVFASSQSALAQWSAGPDGSQCYCVRPVAQTFYQTVPVTEYQPVKQVVKRPVFETKWVDREVTEYQPVTETQTAEVPYITYQNVTEYHPVTRDCGQWISQCHQRPVISPCEYDPRPGFAGWWNRTAYSIRSTFTPKTYVTRHYIPNVVTTMVPITRQVAVRETRQVTYNVTRMVPQTTTRKVAVNEVRYIDEEVTAMRPVTVMRTIPIGTRTAYVPMTPGPTQTALQPFSDPISSGTSPKRTVDRRNAEPSDSSGARDRFQNSGSLNNLDSSQAEPVLPRRSSLTPASSPANDLSRSTSEGRRRAEDEWQVVTIPTAVRVHRWTAKHRALAAGSDSNASAMSYAHP